MSEDLGVWGETWESEGEQPWEGGARSRRLARGKRLGASLYELSPGATGGLYHFHHGNEELLVVLEGRPTLRTPEGERELDCGEVVHFGLGASGAHQVKNLGQEPVRYLVASNLASPDAVEYPDQGQLSVMAFSETQDGSPLWRLFGDQGSAT
jgi:uncharacterized cupin superfamily protein